MKIGLALLAIWLLMAMAQLVKLVDRCRKARRMLVARMKLSEILFRLAASQALTVYTKDGVGNCSALRLDVDRLLLIEDYDLPESSRTTFPIEWPRLIKMLLDHVRLDDDSPYGVRRYEFAEEAEPVLLYRTCDDLADQLHWTALMVWILEDNSRAVAA